MSHYVWKKYKANFLFFAFIGILWSINALHQLQNDSDWFLKPLILNAVGNGDRMLRNNFFVASKCPGGRDTINCQMPGPRDSPCIPRGRGMLAAGIDSHIMSVISIVSVIISLPTVALVFIKSIKATLTIAIKPAQKWCCCNSPACIQVLFSNGCHNLREPTLNEKTIVYLTPCCCLHWKHFIYDYVHSNSTEGKYQGRETSSRSLVLAK